MEIDRSLSYLMSVWISNLGLVYVTSTWNGDLNTRRVVLTQSWSERCGQIDAAYELEKTQRYGVQNANRYVAHMLSASICWRLLK